MSGISLRAQTVAEDWSQTDCDGVDHELYATLDTGTVVVMEIVMLDGCMPCINAAHWMEPVIDNYNALYPGRVQWYTFGYDDSYPCTELAAWKSENEIGCTAQFVAGADIAAYYGGMGMPTIVVAGRASHTVYFNQFGFVPADTVEFSDAIAYALGIAEPEVSIQEAQPDVLTMYPNPSTGNLIIDGDFSSDAQITVSGMNGQLFLDLPVNDKQIDVSPLPSGTYIITCADGKSLYRNILVRQ